MRKIILLLFWTFQLSMTFAQELTVTYEATYNTASHELFADAGLPEEMRSNLATAYKNVVTVYQLVVNGEESEFRVIPSDTKQEIVFMGRTIDVNAAMQLQSQNYTYKNHEEGIILDKTQSFGKDFIVLDSIKTKRFILQENEKKDILGFECTKAISDDGKIIAWYTQNIQIKDEPIASGLDGLILQFDNGQQTYTATKILDVVKKKIIRPSGEKFVTKEEFSEMVKKRIEMMKRN